MRNWDRSDEDETVCSVDQDFEDMKRICDRLNIASHEVVDSLHFF